MSSTRTIPQPSSRNAKRQSVPNAPKVTFNAGFDWDIFDKGDSKLALRGDASYMGKYYFDAFGDYGLDPCDKPGAPGAGPPCWGRLYSAAIRDTGS